MNIYNPGKAELLLERGKVWKSMPMIGSYFNGLDKQDELNLSILFINNYLIILSSFSYIISYNLIRLIL